MFWLSTISSTCPMTVAEKRCNRCGITKPIEDFSLNRSKSMGRQCTCKSCYNEHHRILNRLHREHRIPVDHSCPICGRGQAELQSPSGRTTTPWRLDHNHKTEEFRGFLCDRCNTGLGKFDDNIELLKKAIQYLES